MTPAGGPTQPATLEEWQTYLERHYKALADARASFGLPVFAFEHGLGPEERGAIATQLKDTLRRGDRLSSHWLLWVIYATEFGYRYEGDEFWDSFIANTPGWHHSADGELRHWFLTFQKRYRGYQPTGPWASHFSRISWPITHSILPKYLQIHLAGALYHLRHELLRADFSNPSEVGRLLADNAWDAPTRFQKFLEQEELAGRIVLSLLDQQRTAGGAIHGATLDRITADLQEVRQAREWLRDTRVFVKDRFTGVGTDRRLFGSTNPESGDRTPQRTARAQPRLFLRRTSPGVYAAFLELPALAEAARESRELGEIIRSVRCKVADGTSSWMPRGWLATDSQRRSLKSWPDPRRPALSFERSVPLLEHILGSECRISVGPRWLFRIGADGIGHEVSGQFVRPGQDYVLLTKDGAAPASSDLLSPCRVECEGIAAVALSIPAAVSQDQIGSLIASGIGVKRSIKIWPAGLSGRDWDGEGRSTWLTTEAPCLGIVHDHPVDSYSLQLNNDHPVVVSGQNAGQPIFIKLPRLPPGRHRLAVKATRVGVSISAAASPDLEGVAALDVRHPKQWRPGTTAHTGLAVLVDPPTPDLDELWDGAVRLSIFGPEGRSIKCSVALTNVAGEELLSGSIGEFELPVDGAKWADRFRKYAANDERTWTYLTASGGKVIVEAEELGQYILNVDRSVRPVRLVCRRTQRGLTLRLIDDTGSAEKPTLLCYPFDAPLDPMLIAIEDAVGGMEVVPPGGVYIATLNAHAESVVASAQAATTVHGGFSGLVIQPTKAALDMAARDVPAALEALGAWTSARLAGSLADARRSHTVRAILSSLYNHLCGTPWAHAEQTYLSHPETEESLQALARSVGATGPHRSFAAALRHNLAPALEGPEPAAAWFAEKSARYGLSADGNVSRFALRVATEPSGLPKAYGDQLRALLDATIAHPVLLRGARLVALCVARTENPEHSDLLPRWSW